MSELPRCQSVFKNGANKPTTQEFTQVWIALINRLEHSKANLAGI